MEDGGPSVTARRVAAHRLGFSRVPAPYGVPAADDALAADVAAGLVAPANRMHDYLAARTSFFDRTVVSAIDRGVRQVVVGAAGYDGRAFRYAKPGVRWFEVDHPATQRDKLERLQRLGIAAPHVRFVEADFTRDPVADRLRSAGLEAAAPSLFLLEGVAVYLEPAVLEIVLEQFRQVAAPGSRLAISVSLSREHDEGARARFQAAVAALGEPARSTFDADQAEDLLARTGWRTMPGREETAAKRERLRSAGLLTASAGPRAPQASAPSRLSKQPGQPTSPTLSARPPGSLSLSALLSQALVAFTIEFDNEAEHRLPHRTTDHGASVHGDGAWLVSLVIWENCLRHVTDQPITVGELETRARTGTNLDGMRRWGYITIDGTARKIHKGRPGPDAVLRATAAGLRAREVWLPLPGLIEQRWRERFGAGQVDRLRESLVTVASQLDPGLPDCLPILGAALLSRGPDPALPPAGHVGLAGLPLSALLSRVLLSFALEYEHEAGSVPRDQRERAACPGRRRGPAARPPAADRHLQRGRQLGAGHRNPGAAGGRGAGPGREPRQDRPSHSIGDCRRSASTTSSSVPSSSAGASASPAVRSTHSGRRWKRWPPRPTVRRRPCSRGWSPTRTTGEPRSAARPPCRITRWSCTAVATPTAANSRRFGQASGRRRSGSCVGPRPTRGTGPTMPASGGGARERFNPDATRCHTTSTMRG